MSVPASKQGSMGPEQLLQVKYHNAIGRIHRCMLLSLAEIDDIIDMNQI